MNLFAQGLLGIRGCPWRSKNLLTRQLRHPYQQGKPKRRPHHERQHALHWKTLKIHSTLGRFHQQWLYIYIYGRILMLHDLLWTSTVSFYWMFVSSASFCWSIVDGTKLQRLGAIGPWNSRRSREATLDVNHVARYKIVKYDTTTMLHDTKSHTVNLFWVTCHDRNQCFSSCCEKRLVPAFCLFSPPGRVADGRTDPLSEPQCWLEEENSIISKTQKVFGFDFLRGLCEVSTSIEKFSRISDWSISK